MSVNLTIFHISLITCGALISSPPLSLSKSESHGLIFRDVFLYPNHVCCKRNQSELNFSNWWGYDHHLEKTEAESSGFRTWPPPRHDFSYIFSRKINWQKRSIHPIFPIHRVTLGTQLYHKHIQNIQQLTKKMWSAVLYTISISWHISQ